MSTEISLPHSTNNQPKEGASMQSWYQAIIEKSVDAIILVDRNYTPLYSNSSVQRLFEGTHSDFLQAQSVRQRIAENDFPLCVEMVENLLRQPGGSSRFSFRWQRQDGSWRWLEALLTNSLEEAAIGAIVGVFRDITEQKHTEEVFLANENRFNLLMNEAFDAIFLTELNGHILEANVQASAIFGYSLAEFQQLNLDDVLYPEGTKEESAQRYSNLIRAEQRLRTEVAARSREGNIMTLETVSNVLSDGHVLVILRDVSERKNAEQDLRSSEQQYRLVMEHSSDIIVLIDPRGRWFYASPATEKVLGYTPGEIMQTNPLTLVHEEDRPLVQECVSSSLQGQSSTTTYRYKHRDGNWIILEATCSAIFDEDDHPIMLVFTAHDVTKRTENEQRKDDFLSMTSHELRNPLTTIKASLQLAQRQLKRVPETPIENIVPRLAELLSMAERQVVVENRLISDLLDVSRIQQNKLELQLKLCNLGHIVREVVQDLQAIEQKRQITLQLPQEDFIPVVADSDRLGQVLSNYLTNAIKYSPADQPIEVIVSIHHYTVPTVRVAVRDYGQGLNASEQQHIWERFYQSPDRQGTSNSSGLGLGLYICRNIIEQHHGHVGIDSAPGKGSTFWFTLPLKNSEEE